MRALEKPNPEHNYNVSAEVDALVDHRDRVHANPDESRNIPSVGQPGRILIATWNIANLGVHKRRQSDIEVISEILSWFEIVAIQEVADDLTDFNKAMDALPDHFGFIFSDRAGNDERSAYIYDTRRVELGEKIGEIVIVDSDRRYIKLPGIQRVFHGFNRNPYLASFRIENKPILLANCHLLYGPSGSSVERAASIEKRQLEAFAVSRWCDLRRKDKHAWTEDIIALGDFNLPKAETGDAIFDALRNRGLRLPEHETRIPTNVSNSFDYDQVAVTPGLVSRTIETGVFDFDEVIFSDIYDSNAPGYWRKCAKYYISDHRPLWVQIEL